MAVGAISASAATSSGASCKSSASGTFISVSPSPLSEARCIGVKSSSLSNRSSTGTPSVISSSSSLPFLRLYNTSISKKTTMPPSPPSIMGSPKILSTEGNRSRTPDSVSRIPGGIIPPSIESDSCMGSVIMTGAGGVTLACSSAVSVVDSSANSFSSSASSSLKASSPCPASASFSASFA